MHGIEALVARRGEDANEVDGDLGVAERGRQRLGIADVGLDGLDLADAAERLQVVGEVWAAAPGHDAEPGAGERPDDVAPEEA